MKKLLFFFVAFFTFFIISQRVLFAQSCPAGYHATNPTVCLGPAQAYCTDGCTTINAPPDPPFTQCNGDGAPDSAYCGDCTVTGACGQGGKWPACNCVPDSGGPGTTPPVDPGGGGCTPTSTTCGGGTCCSPQVCLTDGSGLEWCGINPWPTTDPGGNPGPPDCSATQGTTYCVGSNVCWINADCTSSCGACTNGCDAVAKQCFNGYQVTGTVYDDANGNGVKDPPEPYCLYSSVSFCKSRGFTCPDSNSRNCFDDLNNNNVRDLGEKGVSGVVVSLSGKGTKTTDTNGRFTFSSVLPNTYTISIIPPLSYAATTTNPKSLSVVSNTTSNFGLKVNPAPECPGGLTANPSTLSPGGNSTLSVTSCTDVENPDDGNPPPPFDWDPPNGNPPGSTNPQCSDGIDNDGVQGVDSADPDCHLNGDPSQPYKPNDDSESTPSNTCNDGGTGSPTNTATSSTVTYTAPSCPASPLSCVVSVDVEGSGGTVNYTTNITIPATYTLSAFVRSVTSDGSCTSTSGTPYTDSSVNLNVSGGSLSAGGLTQNTSTGSTNFACLPGGNYKVSLSVPPGYGVLGRGGGTASGANGIGINPLSSNANITFCIAPVNPWFQTDFGDVRFNNLSNPVPPGNFASTSTNYPGIFYSSNGAASLGGGSVSTRGWVVNSEYSYNTNSQNINGGMSYYFYKNKASQDGVPIRQLTPGTFVQNEIANNEKVLYESDGDLTINSYTHPAGRNIVILVNGNLTINGPISVNQNQGIFIVAVKGNIIVSKTVGTSNVSSTASQIDGFYTAQGSIIVDGDKCSDGSTSDLRLNVGGALIANSLKPLAVGGTGSIQNKRSLCLDNPTNPSLYVSSRPDFLVQLTDFYKVSYTKLNEVNP